MVQLCCWPDLTPSSSTTRSPSCRRTSRPSSCTPEGTVEFNERIQVDSHWIQCEDSAVAQREPAPGTPAAKREKREISGRQCVLTIVDHATRFCAIRILKGETAEEFTKGIERMWFKHLGVPKYIRIYEAKGWTSKHVREWAGSRAITLEVQPAEQHTWLGVVERKHQVIRRALELYQDDLGRHDLTALKEAAIYVPHAINQTAMVRGFTPQQWVLGKSMTDVHGLTLQPEVPGCVRASGRCTALLVLACVWNWHFTILQKAKWRGPARVVAI